MALLMILTFDRLQKKKNIIILYQNAVKWPWWQLRYFVQTSPGFT